MSTLAFTPTKINDYGTTQLTLDYTLSISGQNIVIKVNSITFAASWPFYIYVGISNGTPSYSWQSSQGSCPVTNIYNSNNAMTLASNTRQWDITFTIPNNGNAYYLYFTACRQASGKTSQEVSHGAISQQLIFPITYYANGANGSTAAQRKIHTVNLALQQNNFTRDGFTFKRWNTEATDNGTAYNAGATYSGNAALNLYAIWNHSVTFNANGGSGAPAKQEELSGTAITLSSTQPTRTDHFFRGWNTKADGTGTDYNPGGSLAANDPSITLYAKWEYYRKPNISSLLCTRCDSEGELANEGTYMLVQANWRITKYRSTVAPTSIGIVVKDEDDETVTSVTETQFTPTESGNDLLGTSEFVVAGPFNINKKYNIAVTITDTEDSYTVYDVLTTSFYPWDVIVGGNGVAFGKAATQENLLDVGYDINCDGNVTCVALTQTSDRNAKKHLRYLGEEAAQMIDELEPALFIHEGKRLMGFYAQDVQEADVYESDIVAQGPGAFLTLNYTALMAPLVAYVQMLEERIVELENGYDEDEEDYDEEE